MGQLDQRSSRKGRANSVRNPYYLIPYAIREALNPRQWMRELKWKRQRVSRGWSDYDAWGAGDHIAKITAEMLQHLNDHAYCDWPEWFKLNVKEEGKGAYTNLQQVIDDINAYLVFSETSWADGLTTKTIKAKDLFEERQDGLFEMKESSWYREKDGVRVTEKQITQLINKWYKENTRRYKKAQKAMQFFGRHFTQFWD